MLTNSLRHATSKMPRRFRNRRGRRRVMPRPYDGCDVGARHMSGLAVQPFERRQVADRFDGILSLL
jgi:hypothetical protein